MDHVTNAMIAGVLTLAASFFLGAKQILGSPNAVNYPHQRPLSQAVSFALSAMLLLRGADLVLGCWHGDPERIHFTAILGSGALATFFGARLWDVLHMRAPARFWRRVDRALGVLNCRPWFDPFARFDPLERARREAMLAVYPSARQAVPDTADARVALAEGILSARPGDFIDQAGEARARGPIH